MTFLLQFVLNVLAGAIIAFVTAYFTVRWSLHRFRSEKIWDKKFEVYSVLHSKINESISSLNNLRNSILLGHPEVSSEEFTKLYQTYKASTESYVDLERLWLSKEGKELVSKVNRAVSAAREHLPLRLPSGHPLDLEVRDDERNAMLAQLDATLRWLAEQHDELERIARSDLELVDTPSSWNDLSANAQGFFRKRLD